MTVTIQRATDDQIPAAKAVIVAGCLEFFGEPPKVFEDMDDIAKYYREPSGLFLVLLDGKQVAGTGAVRRLDEQTCELKRMWFLPAYRGRGYGSSMARQLIAFARATGYRSMRLDTQPELAAANKLYQRLGFMPIKRYNNGPGTVFMEKPLLK